MTKAELKKFLKRDDLTINGNTAKWTINSTGLHLGSYKGTFEFKTFLLPSEKLGVGRLYRQLLGEQQVLALAHEESLSFALAQLKYRTLAWPPFWESYKSPEGLMGDLPDENIIDEVLNHALDCELKYMAILEDKKEKALLKAKKAGEAIIENQQKDDDEVLKEE
jgi:hypothetical protein